MLKALLLAGAVAGAAAFAHLLASEPATAPFGGALSAGPHSPLVVESAGAPRAKAPTIPASNPLLARMLAQPGQVAGATHVVQSGHAGVLIYAAGSPLPDAPGTSPQGDTSTAVPVNAGPIGVVTVVPAQPPVDTPPATTPVVTPVTPAPPAATPVAKPVTTKVTVAVRPHVAVSDEPQGVVVVTVPRTSDGHRRHDGSHGRLDASRSRDEAPPLTLARSVTTAAGTTPTATVQTATTQTATTQTGTTQTATTPARTNQIGAARSWTTRSSTRRSSTTPTATTPSSTPPASTTQTASAPTPATTTATTATVPATSPWGGPSPGAGDGRDHGSSAGGAGQGGGGQGGGVWDGGGWSGHR